MTFLKFGLTFADWYMNGSRFLEKLVFVWVYFQIPQRDVPTKTKLEYPPADAAHQSGGLCGCELSQIQTKHSM